MAGRTEGRQSAEIRIGLVGRGIGKSLTPIMHEQEGRRLGLRYRYDLVDFDALKLEDRDLALVVRLLEAAGFRGLNVTFPFKQSVLALLDELSDSARAVGAVNTVVFTEGKRRGHNTDCFGFAESMRRGLSDVDLRRVVQIGAGGAGGAVAKALSDLGVRQLAIFDIDEDRAHRLASNIASTTLSVTSHGSGALSTILPNASGVVNASPVGMDKLPGLPLDPNLLTSKQWVADIIYFPRETELIRTARARGCAVLTGGGMAVFQALRAFELFSGMRPDSAEMSKTFLEYA
ncbi:shikimate dehydrogenase [Devosia lucknowensis]|uniref:shikimate dehydrogenase n=1 Tax=Devosia lucknowensis TaxID=1096929 RepID=UPI001AEC91F3|nr:shikimate dehydrogenase [Devosia lucknowensis]